MSTTTLQTFIVRNPSDENETEAWTCEAASMRDAAHRYLATFWSAEQRDNGTWFSPTYTGDIDGGDLEIFAVFEGCGA